MALITFCHFKVLVYAFNAFKHVTLNTEILYSFTGYCINSQRNSTLM